MDNETRIVKGIEALLDVQMVDIVGGKMTIEQLHDEIENVRQRKYQKPRTMIIYAQLIGQTDTYKTKIYITKNCFDCGDDNHW